MPAAAHASLSNELWQGIQGTNEQVQQLGCQLFRLDYCLLAHGVYLLINASCMHAHMPAIVILATHSVSAVGG